MGQRDAGSIQICVALAEILNNEAKSRPNSLFADAARVGRKDIIQVLAPFIGNANARANFWKNSPIEAAIRNGNTEIIELLAPLCDDYKYYGGSLIHLAVCYEQADTIKTIAPFMKNPNADFGHVFTPLEAARKCHGPNHDVTRTLETLQ